METITIWLLVSLGQLAGSGSPHYVVERFADGRECERIAAVLRNGVNRNPVQCIQATVLKR